MASTNMATTKRNRRWTSRSVGWGLLLGGGWLLAGARAQAEEPAASAPKAEAGAEEGEPTTPPTDKPAAPQPTGKFVPTSDGVAQPGEKLTPAAPWVTSKFVPASDGVLRRDLLLIALANNPDIRLAKSQLRSAEAELNRVQLDVARRVAAMAHSLESQRAFYGNSQRLSAKRVIGPAELLKQRADLAAIEADMSYLLGDARIPPETPAGDDKEPAAPIGIEKLLLTAMEKNPDILLAKAKVDEAKDELNRVQRSVMRKLAVLYQTLVAQRRELEHLVKVEKISAKAVVGMVDKALIALNESESELEYLTGGHDISSLVRMAEEAGQGGAAPKPAQPEKSDK
ncbi:MAG TPA: hypothetical protein VMF30_01145 [Pirellulales bacterium]|nr:hypothetical protein [Pirellulales bacterium]